MSYSPVMDNDYATEVSSTNTSRPFRVTASLRSRLSPLLVSLLSLAISVVPVALEWSDTTFDSKSALFSVALNHRQSVQAVVSIIAAFLGFLWGYSACGTFNMFMRGWIAKKGSVPVEHLRLSLAISSKTRASNLSGWLQLVSLLWFLVGLLPAVIWTGALTPGRTTTSTDIENSLPVSQAGFEGQSIFPHINDFVLADHCNGLPFSNGTQHSCPGSVFSGLIVDSMRAASALPNETSERNHTKLDKTGYNYIGRSYGAGASAGLFEPHVWNTVESYSYIERGYVASANCIYNASSAWKFNHSTENVNQLPVPSIFSADGYRPNEDFRQPFTVKYYTTSFEQPRRMVAFSAGGCCGFYNGTPPFVMSIAAGEDYLLLNSTQCDLSFQPKMFNVTVFPLNRAIKVTPKDDIAGTGEGEFLEWTVSNLQTTSMTQTTLYISTIAEALGDNMHSKTGVAPAWNAVPPSRDQLAALGESMAAALDDIMEALNGYGLAVPNGWRRETVSVRTAVVKIGSRGFNIAILIFNLVSFAIILLVTASTKFFRSSPTFDFADLPCMLAGAACYVVTAASKDGGASTRALHHSHLEDWRGDPKDSVLQKSVVEIDCGTGSTTAPTVMLQSPAARNQRGQEFELTDRGKLMTGKPRRTEGTFRQEDAPSAQQEHSYA